MKDKFFDRYSVSAAHCRCKVQLKACLAVFRSIINVEKCNIILDEKESRLVFDMLCKFGVKKVFKLTYEDCEPIQAVYDKEDKNKIVAKTKKFIRRITKFSYQC